MTNNTQLVSVPRHLIDNAINYMEGSASATVLVWRDRLIDAMEAAPAEDVRAVVEEPVISSAGDAWLWHELRDKNGDGSGLTQAGPIA
jgi:hypothetical protein